uniref:Uncharacterized protein n=1 Tax=Arundo donax TaxID=35708 RepID=A0A0A9CMD8_ARUDO
MARGPVLQSPAPLRMPMRCMNRRWVMVVMHIMSAPMIRGSWSVKALGKLMARIQQYRLPVEALVVIL